MNHLVPITRRTTPGANEAWAYPGPPPGPSPDRDGAPVDVRELFAAIRRRLWLVLLVTAALGGGAYFMVSRTPAVYRAKAVIQLVDSRRALVSGLVGTPEAVGAFSMSILSQVEILQSRAVAGEVTDSEPVGTRVHTAGFPPSLLSNVHVEDSLLTARLPLTFTEQAFVVGTNPVRRARYGDLIDLGKIQFSVARYPGVAAGALVVLPRERGIDAVLAGVTATPRRNTSIIDIWGLSSDPAVARRLVNRTATAYQAVNARLAQQQSRRRRLFIEDQLRRNDGQLALAERVLSDFRRGRETFGSQERAASEQAALLVIDTQRQELEAERRMYQGLLRGLELHEPSERREALRVLVSFPALTQNPVVSRLHTQLLDYETSRGELTSGVRGRAPTDPDVQRLDTLISATTHTLVQAIKGHVSYLDTRIESLEGLRAQRARALREIPAAETEDMRLMQNAAALRDQAALLRTEYQEARIAEAAEVGQVEIVDLAARAFAVEGQGGRTIFFGVLLGMLFGSGGALLIEHADRTLKRREQVESALGLPVVATVPQIKLPGVRRNGSSRFASVGERRLADALWRRGVALVSVIDSRSPGAEAYRQLRTNLLHSRPNGGTRRIMVTSARPGEGKTTVASNLAASLAQVGWRVLVLDCDLRGGKLHRIFQLHQNPGLTHVLLEDGSAVDAMRPTWLSGLFVLPSGTLPPNPGEAIGSRRMRALLNDVSRDFDAVILDSPPVLAVSDAVILSAAADTVLFVVRAGSTSPSDAVEALRHLSAVNAQISGAVLNDPDAQVRHYGGYCYGYPRS